MIHRRVLALALVLADLAAPLAHAQDDFYKGKTVNIVVGFTAGGGYDVNARAVARHLGKHIPGNPNVIVQNMPGAGSLQSVRYLDATAPKDGTVMTVFNPGLITQSIVEPERVSVDFRKLAWVGIVTADYRVCYGFGPNGVKSWDEMMKRKEFILGSTAKGAGNYVNGATLRLVFGAPVRQILGFPGSAEQRIAIERGELDGDCGAWSSIPLEWIEGRKIVPVIRSSPSIAPDMPPDVPYSVDIAPSERDRQVLRMLLAPTQVGRPFIASQAVPAERVRILRDAFNATMQDPQFMAEAQKLRLPISPKTGEEALKVVEEIYATPDDIVAAARKVTAE
jgi:tripartite-type tricarboxylate transporter receptor subunit TctC